MREIKFRVWDKGEMHTTFCVTSQGCIRKHLIGLPFESLENTIIMQYTGLKDKNACVYENDIYEDDILAINQIGVGEDIVRKVYFENGGFYIDGRWSLWEVLSNNKKVKVIGNIWENPELLKEGEHNGRT